MSYFGRKWWVFAIQGALAIVFGLLCFLSPAISLAVLIGFVGAFFLVTGVTALFATERESREGRPWGWHTFEGIVSLVAAGVTWFYPGETAVLLLAFIAIWAIIVGVARIAMAIRLRKVMQDEWLLSGAGILSIIFGVMMLIWPGAGALAVLWIIGAYALVFGGMLLMLGFRLHSLERRFETPTRPQVPA